MTEPKFYDTKGRLTAYALACGYVAKFEKMGQSLTLWAEHGVYHVRQHSHIHNKRIMWETFENLNDARKCYSERVKHIESLCYVE